MNLVTIIQARMTSERLPGKVLLPIAGKPMLQWVVEAAPEPRIVALPNEFPSLEIVKALAPLDVPMFIPDAGIATNDVLSRFMCCVEERAPMAEFVLRLTADCPMLNHKLVDSFLSQIEPEMFTIYTNRPRDIDGYDMELFSTDMLRLANLQAQDAYDREHVTPYMYRVFNVQRLSVFGVGAGVEGRGKCSVDTEQEYKEACYALS